MGWGELGNHLFPDSSFPRGSMPQKKNSEGILVDRVYITRLL
jgi:hypothetical protein